MQDLKLGHYMKIPPRATFAGVYVLHRIFESSLTNFARPNVVQIVSTSLTSLVQVGVTRWLVGRVPDLCQARQSFLLTCPTARVYYSTSVFWYAILSLDVSVWEAQQKLIRRTMFQGFNRTRPSIRVERHVQPDSLLAARWRGASGFDLDHRQTILELVHPIREHPRRFDGRYLHAPSDRNQLLFVVPRWIHFP